MQKLAGDERDDVLKKWVAAINKSDVSVFAVMDYWTFDGYLALRDYDRRHPGELRKTVLPGIELRVQAPKSERLDIHAILSDQLPDQRLRDFQSKLIVQLMNGSKHPLSADCLREFARSLRGDQLTGHSRERLLSDDDYAWIVGSEKCEVLLDSFRAAVDSLGPDSAVIYQPWDTYHGLKDAKWREHYATAYQLFTQPDIFECKGAEYRAAFVGQKTADNEAFFDGFWEALGERSRLAVRGSDAHRFSDYGVFQSNLTTWIKAAPTFRGLLQAVKEPHLRSWLGDSPPKRELVRNKPTAFIDKIEIQKVPGAKLTSEDWFDGQSILMNPDLVAVIGSKGSGKSALADIVALLGDTANEGSFSFLNDKRFRDRKNNRSKNFEGELTWGNGVSTKKLLSEDPISGAVERVRYIPAQYFERVCAGHSEDDITEFTSLIERVIFSYVPTDLRGDTEDLRELLKRQETQVNRRLERLRTDVRQQNADIRELQERSSVQVHEELKSMLILREQQLADLANAKPSVEAQSSDAQEADPNVLSLEKMTAQRTELATQMTTAQKEIAQLQSRRQANERVTSGLRGLRSLVNDELSRLGPDAKLAGINLSKVVTFSLDEEALKVSGSALATQVSQRKESAEGSADGSLASRITAVDEEIRKVRSLLDAKQLSAQAGRERLAVWQAAMTALNGAADVPTSIAYVQAQIAAVELAPTRLGELRTKRFETAREIATELLSIQSAREGLVEEARATIDAAIRTSPGFSLGFINELFVSRLEDDFFDIVKQVSGTFRGETEGRRTFREFVESCPLTSADEIVRVATGLEDLLTKEQHSQPVVEHDLEALVRKGKTPEDVLNLLYGLEYVNPRFSLALAGQPLTQLSPGQRGALLLIFYLLVEGSDLPIVLDQPEENLDNETVYSLLVPAIKQAKGRRQIIMVTHNANLAVCCDAEQIIHASFDKSQRSKLTYRSGAIEDPEINALVVDVLEGTRPAFDNRRTKYQGPENS